MALIKCPECKKEVSDTAEICPHCGFRLKKQQPNYVDLSVEKSIRHHFVKEMVAAVILAILGLVCIIIGIMVEVIPAWLTGVAILIGSIVGFIYNFKRYKNY